MSHQLNVMVLNAQDLFIFMDKYQGQPIAEMNEIQWNLMSSSLINNKSKEKCFILGKTILDLNSDIVMMTEVGGLESLQNFAKYVLEDKYEAYSLPSNSDRGIDLGYLVKKILPFKSRLKSYIHYPLQNSGKKFSRDVLQLDLFENEKLLLTFLLVHIKSKLDLRKTDFEGRGQRVLEIKGLLDIFKKLKANNVPILIGGDFNGHAGEKDTEEEFQIMYAETNLKDVAHLQKVPEDERFSYIYFNRGGNRFLQQIDYLFIEEIYADRLIPGSACFPRYRNLEGLPLPIPKRAEQKNLLPSDHYPFFTTIRV